MIIKLEKIISCTSEDPSYPASNLLQQRSNSSWRCAKPGELLASVIFQLREPSCITGMDIGNYRCCIVVVEASTSVEPDNWIPIINHQFMTHDEAANGKFKDQVQLFTKKELNADTLKVKFDRVKVTCMQSANLREAFGLAFVVLRTEVVVDVGVDVFARFKLNNPERTVDDLKDKYLNLFPSKRSTYKDDLAEKIKQAGASKFAERQREAGEPAKNDDRSPASHDRKKDITGSGKTADEPNSSAPVARTPFGDAIIQNRDKNNKKNIGASNSKKRSLFYDDSSDENDATSKDESRCSACAKDSRDRLCKICKRLPAPRADDLDLPAAKKVKKIIAKPSVEFSKLFQDVKFALSGFQNPRRDEIRRKALKMGAKYIPDPNTTDNRCTHLVCAFDKTPKSRQLAGYAKIVSHKFIVDCFDAKTRFPWRRFALDKKEKTQSESEDEIEAAAAPALPPDPYEQDTDSDSNY